MQFLQPTFSVSDIPGGGWVLTEEQYGRLVGMKKNGAVQLKIPDYRVPLTLTRVKEYETDGDYYCLRRGDGGSFMISPVTQEDIRERPDIKLFEITENKKNSKRLIAGAEVRMAAAAIVVAILAHTSTTEDTPGEAMRSISPLQHHILNHPIPNINLYKSLSVKTGQNIGQLIGEYHISLGKLLAMNPQLQSLSRDGFLTQDSMILIPEAQDVFVLNESTTWNAIGEKYGISPHVLTRINGFSIKIGDTIIIPTAKQARDIMDYLDGEDITLKAMTVDSDITLAEIARLNDIPRHLYELYIELNCGNPDTSDPRAIISDSQMLRPGARVVIPTVRDMSQELSIQLALSRPRYDMHKVTPEDTIDSITRWLGLTAEEFQRLNPTIPLNSKLRVDTYIRTKDISQSIAGVQAQVVLPKEVIAFVKSVELGAAKEGYLREGLSQKTVDGKFKFANDAITLESGIDLGQIEQEHLLYALGNIIPEPIKNRILELARVVKKHKGDKGTTLKKIPADFSDLVGFRLTERQTNDIKKRVLQVYWDTYIIKMFPHLNHPDIPHQIKSVILSMIFQRGPSFLKKDEHVDAFNAIKRGDWKNPSILKAISDGKPGTESRTQRELDHYMEGLKSLQIPTAR